MPSRLYQSASSLLSDAAQADLAASETWLSSHAVGVQLLDNLKKEAHLVGDDPFGDPSVYSTFFVAWSSQHILAASDSDRRSSYCGACSVHELRGSRIPPEVLPFILVRYLTSRTVLRRMIERMLGEDAVVDFDAGEIDLEDVFERLEMYWDPSRFQATDRLGKGEGVFATFGRQPGNARQTVEALAHPVLVSPLSGEEFLFLLRYRSSDVEDHRIPTVADAAWFPLFEPAPDVPPDPRVFDSCFGWTKPLGGQRAQPELVHRNSSLKIVSEAPSFVGRP